MTRTSNWDEIIRAANVMVRFLFSTSLLGSGGGLHGPGGGEEREMEHSRLVATRQAPEHC